MQTHSSSTYTRSFLLFLVFWLAAPCLEAMAEGMPIPSQQTQSQLQDGWQEGEIAKKKKKRRKKRRKGKRKKRKAKRAMKGSAIPYGMAGCGLGTLVFQEKDLVSQIMVSSTNNTGYQSFAVTTGTSNCVDNPSEWAMAEQRVFLAANFHELSKQAARGQGAHLEAFSETFGCPAGGFSDFTRQHFSRLFTHKDAHVVVENYHQQLAADPEFKASCSRG